MSVLKAVVSFYRTGEERPIERYKARLKVQEEHRTLSTFKKIVIGFLGLNEQATKFGLGSFVVVRWPTSAKKKKKSRQNKFQLAAQQNKFAVKRNVTAK